MRFFRALSQIVALIFIFVSCSNVELLDENVSTSSSSGSFRIEVSTSDFTCDNLSVIYLMEVGEDGKYAKRNTYLIDQNTLSADGGTVEFTGADLTSGKEYVAYNALYSGVILTATYYDIYALFCSEYGYNRLPFDNIGEQMQSNKVEYTDQELLHFDLQRQSTILELEIKVESSSDYSGQIAALKIESNAPEDVFLSTVLFNSDLEQVIAIGTDASQYGVTSSIELTFGSDKALNSWSTTTLNVPVSWNDYISDASGDLTFTLTTTDDKMCSVSHSVESLEAGESYPLQLTFGEPMDDVDRQRAALIDLYNATDGDNWTNNTNWCSDADLSEWYGVSTLSSDLVGAIDLQDNNLCGELPASMSCFIELQELQLSNNNISGSIPLSIDELENLQYVQLSGNMLSGTIPSAITSLQSWNQAAWDFVAQQSGYGFDDDFEVCLESSTLTTQSGEVIETSSFFSDNRLTCVVWWSSLSTDNLNYLQTLEELYESYSDDGFEIISLSCESYDVPGYNCILSGDHTDYAQGTNRVKYLPTTASLNYAFVNRNGKILFSEALYPITGRLEDATTTFVEEYFDESLTQEEVYYSKDYSLDGSVMQLQTSTQGTGIDIVIMGDGFTDLDMASGEYDRRMSEAMEHFFSEEPYTTFRDRYNVYSVAAVSKNGGITDDGQTALSCEFGGGTYISGSNSTVFSYALKVPSISAVSNVTIIVILNSYMYAGTCYMYSSEAAIAYCPIVYDSDESFRQIVTHEAGGHGFAKLADEYYYSSTVTTDVVDYYQKLRDLGWYINIDVTDDEDEIAWAHLLSDSRYDGLVGIYEGAFTYKYGAYRSSEYSIMRYNTGGYNAPSREEIYRRIMELSGETYSYEEFVAYDAVNISASALTRAHEQTAAVDSHQFTPLSSPVVIFDASTK